MDHKERKRERERDRERESVRESERENAVLAPPHVDEIDNE